MCRARGRLLAALVGVAVAACSRTTLRDEAEPEAISDGAASGSGGATASSSSVSTSVSSSSVGVGGGCDEHAWTCVPTGDCEMPPPTVAAPLLRYRFDGNTLNDGSLVGFDGQATGVSYGAGKVGQAVRFSGVQSSVVIPDTPVVMSTLPDVTIGMWFREDTYFDDGEFPKLLDCRGSGNGFETYHGVSAPCSLTTCWGFGHPSLGPGGCGTAFYLPGPWHHLSYRYDGSSTDEGGGADLELAIDGRTAVVMDNAESWPMFTPGLKPLTVGEGSIFWADDLVIYDRTFDARSLCLEVIGGRWCGSCCELP